MPELPYLLGVLAVVFVVDLALRTLPFAVLGVIRTHRIVQQLSAWTPAGILAILALATLRGTVTAATPHLLWAGIALTVTVVVHLLGSRRTLLSVGAGTTCYVLLVNLL